MKIQHIEGRPTFKPIVLTIESKEEAEALFAVFNHIALARILVDHAPSLRGLSNDLWRLANNRLDYGDVHRKICNLNVKRNP